VPAGVEGQNEHMRSKDALQGVSLGTQDRLPVDTALDLAAELLMLIRGADFESYTVANHSQRYGAGETILHLADEFQCDRATNPPNDVSRPLFILFPSYTSDGQVQQMLNGMPRAVQGLAQRPCPECPFFNTGVCVINMEGHT